MTGLIRNMPRAMGQAQMALYAEGILARVDEGETELDEVLRSVAREHNTAVSEARQGLAWLGNKVSITHRSPLIEITTEVSRDGGS